MALALRAVEAGIDLAGRALADIPGRLADRIDPPPRLTLAQDPEDENCDNCHASISGSCLQVTQHGLSGCLGECELEHPPGASADIEITPSRAAARAQEMLRDPDGYYARARTKAATDAQERR